MAYRKIRVVVQSRLISNSLEFEGIKNGVIDAFPNAEEQDGVFILEPLLDQRARAIEVPHHVGERYIVSTRLRENADGCALNLDAAGFGFVHRIEVAGCGDGIMRSTFHTATVARRHPDEKLDPCGRSKDFPDRLMSSFSPLERRGIADLGDVPVMVWARCAEMAVHRPVVVFAEGAGHWWGGRCGFRKKGIKCAAAF